MQAKPWGGDWTKRLQWLKRPEEIKEKYRR